MTKKKVIVEDGIIAGNYEDKYSSNNFISRYLVNNFIKEIVSIVNYINPKNIHEIGCGEGNLSILLYKNGFKKIIGTDLSKKIISEARKNAKSNNVNINFEAKDVYAIDDTYSAELIIACEVLEHLYEPEKCLRIVKKIASPYLLVSVPREPIWRIMNICRGKHIKSLGNTPGHVQAWTKGGFVKFISQHFKILKISNPIPWTIILAENNTI